MRSTICAVPLLLLLLVLQVLLQPANARGLKSHPVVLIPGDGGNELWAHLNNTKSSWYCTHKTDQPVVLWMKLSSLIYPAVNCLAYNLKLRPNPDGGTQDNEGVSTFVPEFGKVESMEYLGTVRTAALNYFAAVVQKLQKNNGLARNEQIKGAPYDFRKAPDELSGFFTNLKHLIEDTYSLSGNRRVVLTAHSMGGKLALHFLQKQPQQWKDRYVKSFVAIASPFGGVTISLLALLSGYNLGIPMVDQLKFRPVQRSWPSVKYLLPKPELFNEHSTLVSTAARNYTQLNLKQLMQSAQHSEGFAEYERLRRLTDPSTAPGVATHCIFGSGKSTPHTLIWDNLQKFPNQQPRFDFVDGDGTVPLATEKLCQNWRGQQKHAVRISHLSDADHLQLLRDPRLLNAVSCAASPNGDQC